MAYSNPVVGTTGKFAFIAPFTASGDTEYVVVAVRSFVELSKHNVDIYAIYYTPSGIAKEVFEADAKRGAAIISLRNDAGEITDLPDSFIASAPDIGGVKYDRKIISIDIGALPSDLDLSDFASQLHDYIVGKIGVDPVVNIGTMKTIGIVSQEQHDANEDGRTGRITHPETPLDETVRLRRELGEVRLQYDAVFRLARDNGLLTVNV